MAQILKEEITPFRADETGPGVRVFLASTSPRRRDLLSLTGLRFVVQPVAGTEEKAAGNSIDAVELTRTNALTKLEAAVKVSGRRVPWHVVTLAADTVVYFEGDSLGKPQNAEDARGVLRRLRGRMHQVVSTVAMTHAPRRQLGEYLTHTVSTSVEMRDYSDPEIEEYLATGSPFDRAGSYGIQDRPFSPARRVDGCYLNVIGLPLCAVSAMLPSARKRLQSSHIYATCLAHDGVNGE